MNIRKQEIQRRRIQHGWYRCTNSLFAYFIEPDEVYRQVIKSWLEKNMVSAEVMSHRQQSKSQYDKMVEKVKEMIGVKTVKVEWKGDVNEPT